MCARLTLSTAPFRYEPAISLAYVHDALGIVYQVVDLTLGMTKSDCILPATSTRMQHQYWVQCL
jgi:hypothetical protein